MLSRIETQSSLHFATPVRGQGTGQSSEVFSDLLAGESAGAHLVELPKASIPTPRPEVAGDGSRQNPVTSQPGGQILDTPAAGTQSTFNPLAIFEPKAAPGESSTGAQAPQPADENGTPFVPEFQQNLEVVSAYGGSSALNPIYFATPATAQWIADKYGTGEVVAKPYDATGGPYSANGTEYYIQLQNGKLVNAGLLADYYQRMSASEADTVIRQGLGEA
ncbi:MAG TPA: hypothetical protein VNY30_05300 [Bryobacteraceae bacterium]|jgi:hypothetical protein|nr:hypothetical protein [Bryobacteraceae bacterium]